jgi:hypothetical protein
VAARDVRATEPKVINWRDLEEFSRRIDQGGTVADLVQLAGSGW